MCIPHLEVFTEKREFEAECAAARVAKKRSKNNKNSVSPISSVPATIGSRTSKEIKYPFTILVREPPASSSSTSSSSSTARSSSDSSSSSSSSCSSDKKDDKKKDKETGKTKKYYYPSKSSRRPSNRLNAGHYRSKSSNLRPMTPTEIWRLDPNDSSIHRLKPLDGIGVPLDCVSDVGTTAGCSECACERCTKVRKNRKKRVKIDESHKKKKKDKKSKKDKKDNSSGNSSDDDKKKKKKDKKSKKDKKDKKDKDNEEEKKASTWADDNATGGAWGEEDNQKPTGGWGNDDNGGWGGNDNNDTSGANNWGASGNNDAGGNAWDTGEKETGTYDWGGGNKDSTAGGWGDPDNKTEEKKDNEDNKGKKGGKGKKGKKGGKTDDEGEKSGNEAENKKGKGGSQKKDNASTTHSGHCPHHHHHHEDNSRAVTVRFLSNVSGVIDEEEVETTPINSGNTVRARAHIPHLTIASRGPGCTCSSAGSTISSNTGTTISCGNCYIRQQTPRNYVQDLQGHWYKYAPCVDLDTYEGEDCFKGSDGRAYRPISSKKVPQEEIDRDARQRAGNTSRRYSHPPQRTLPQTSYGYVPAAPAYQPPPNAGFMKFQKVFTKKPTTARQPNTYQAPRPAYGAQTQNQNARGKSGWRTMFHYFAGASNGGQSTRYRESDHHYKHEPVSSYESSSGRQFSGGYRPPEGQDAYGRRGE